MHRLEPLLTHSPSPTGAADRAAEPHLGNPPVGVSNLGREPAFLFLPLFQILVIWRAEAKESTTED